VVKTPKRLYRVSSGRPVKFANVFIRPADKKLKHCLNYPSTVFPSKFFVWEKIVRLNISLRPRRLLLSCDVNEAHHP
jgi:hypothetical protein